MNSKALDIHYIGKNISTGGRPQPTSVYTSVNSHGLYKAWRSGGGRLYSIHASDMSRRYKPGVWNRIGQGVSAKECVMCVKGWHFSWGAEFWGDGGWLPVREHFFLERYRIVVARIAVRQLGKLGRDKGVAGEFSVLEYLTTNQARAVAAAYGNRGSLYE